MYPAPITHLSIDGKRISSFTHIKLEQKTNDHHKFEIILDHDVIEIEGGHTINKSKNWLGKSLIITFDSVEFLGYITAVNLENKDGHNGNLILNGYSPTILLEGGTHLCSWVNNTLEGIVNETLETLNIGTEISPVYKDIIEYQVQYNENNYQFLQRLAKQYNEWFYYNGTKILFGIPKRGNVISIEYGREISELRMEISVKDHRQTKFAYNERMNNVVASSSKDQVAGLNELGSHAFYTAAEFYKTKKNSFTNIDSKVKSQIDDLVERKQATASARLHVMKATSNKQGLTVGTLIKVASAKVAGKSDFDIQNYGEYMIISITHHATERSEYFNTFEAIPSGITVPEEPKVALPEAENQLATVVSNADPKKMGRVQLRFDWQIGIMKTSWLRVMTPDAGSSKHHLKNRGHVFIPEVDDQVMVGFEYNDPNRPYVMGGMFHGDNGAGGSTNNNIKSIITKSGNELIFNDGEGKGSIKLNAPTGNSLHMNGDGSIRVFDASGNKMYLDNRGNIDITAPNHITFNSKQVTFNVMDTMQLNVLQKMFINTPFLQQFISTYFHTQAGKALFTSENEIKIESPELYAVGQKKLYLHSDELATLNSKGIVETKGDKGNKQTNKASKYNIALTEITAKCMVDFRPNSSYTGEYGFDWMRMGDTGGIGDTWYAKIIGEYEGFWNFNKQIYDGGKFKVKDWAYDRLMNKFRQMFIPWKKEFYTIPVATIFPNKTAKFTLQLEIEEPPKEITYEFKKEFFSFDKKNIATLTKGKHRLTDELEITCIKEFDTTQNIDVMATDNNDKKHLIGRLKIKANSKAHRSQKDIVFINVTTQLMKGYKNKGASNGGELELTKYLNQALVEPVFDTATPLELDFSSDATFNKIYLSGDNIALQDYLNDMVYRKYDLQMDYRSHYKVYFINERNGYGIAYAIGGSVRSAIVYKDGFSDSTVAHETLHSMGLYHSFDNDSEFIFEQDMTDNVMDYSDIGKYGIPVISTWQWQWSILNKNLN
ncbi:MAG: hypothetical protein JKY08_04805 [Flavobacteriaceae bacterium]|nr:hypothetical protein [Flavobacteriaceae bacterium]